MSPDGELVFETPTLKARVSLLRWLQEGARSLAFRRPRWERLATGPALLAVLVLLQLLVAIGLSRPFYGEGAIFEWRSALVGWGAFLLIVWACYVMRPAPSRADDSFAAPGAAHLLSLVIAQTLCVTPFYMLLYALLQRGGWLDHSAAWVPWAIWLAPTAWGVLAMLVVMLRTGERHAGRRFAALCAVVLSCVLSLYLNRTPAYWTEPEPQSASATDDAPTIAFSQELVEAQAPLLAKEVAALRAQRPGIADMYTITFAPYEGEEVFRRESRMVSDVMARRFDAAGRALQLMNHADELDKKPWATRLNLQRAIAGIARTMDREEDMLFIHVTSHGAQDGELAANFWPLEVAPIRPADLKRWLDEAGIKHRVISISACYAGNWITPLAGEDTLVMTASDADHTSYGCGKKSPLTFFGRAMYDEQLRSKTLSFEQAHAAARKIIDQREKAAGKDDGYSNPQIKVGSRIRPYLDKMRVRLGG
jgi:hypothetical protein